jgi:hypothetical protein
VGACQKQRKSGGGNLVMSMSMSLFCAYKTVGVTYC